MTNHQSPELLEVLTDLTTVSTRLRAALPVIISAAGLDDGWPDTLLAEVIRDVAECIGRLDAAAGLLEGVTGGGEPQDS